MINQGSSAPTSMRRPKVAARQQGAGQRQGRRAALDETAAAEDHVPPDRVGRALEAGGHAQAAAEPGDQVGAGVDQPAARDLFHDDDVGSAVLDDAGDRLRVETAGAVEGRMDVVGHDPYTAAFEQRRCRRVARSRAPGPRTAGRAPGPGRAASGRAGRSGAQGVPPPRSWRRPPTTPAIGQDRRARNGQRKIVGNVVDEGQQQIQNEAGGQHRRRASDARPIRRGDRS